jgi:tRNA threonylcarbamoyladenosine biosynthesis protein TsaE
MLSKSTQETAQIAKTFLDKMLTPVVEQSSLRGKKSKKGREGALVVALSGDLGAGKTAFTKAVARHLGIKDKVTSPTFIIIKKYPLKKSKNYKFLFHLDAYRLKDEKELLHLGWEEIINNKEHMVFIEWPENVSKIIPRGARFIYIKSDENGYRNLELK